MSQPSVLINHFLYEILKSSRDNFNVLDDFYFSSLKTANRKLNDGNEPDGTKFVLLSLLFEVCKQFVELQSNVHNI